MSKQMTHEKVVDFLKVLLRGIHPSTDAVACAGISEKEIASWSKDPSKRGASLIPAETLASLIATAQEWTHEAKWSKAIDWNIQRGNGYYEAIDSDGEHILYQTVYSRALEVADKRLGSVLIHRNARDLSKLDSNQSLRSRWRRALYSRPLDLDQVCAVTGYDAHLVVCMAIEDIEMIHITGNPSEAATSALEALVSEERIAA